MLLETKKQTKGNLVKHEYGACHGFCVDVASVDTTTADAAAMQLGAVLMQVGKTGDYVEFADTFAPATDNIAVLVDTRLTGDSIYTKEGGFVALTDGGTYSLDIMTNGPAILRKGALKFAAAVTAQAAAYTALEGLNIKIEDYSTGALQESSLT